MPTINFESIYTEMINDVNIRFFVPPDDPAFPWVSYDDVAQSLWLELASRTVLSRDDTISSKVSEHGCSNSDTKWWIDYHLALFCSGLSSAVLKGQKLKQWHRVYSLAALSAVKVLAKDLTEVESIYYVMRAY